jgi:serine-type D-Ala-D-Ala carboxypeptidase
MPHPKADWRAAMSFLDSAVARGAAPGAVLGVTHRGERFVHATGQLGADDRRPVTPRMVYDMASLTKVVGLSTVAMLAVQSGELDLDTPVQQYLPQFAGPQKDGVTVRMLLAHTSGLTAWRPLFREVHTRDEAFALVDSTPLESTPGTRDVYSDLGAIVLTQLLEARCGERLDSLLEAWVLRPLGMTSTRYLPPATWSDRIAPTELDPWRGRVLRGEVHDENAAIMDGVSGHAGLFSSVDDLLTFAEWMMDEWNGETAGRRDGTAHRGTAAPTFRRSVVREFTRQQNLVPGSSRALGWDTPSEGSSAGRLLSASSFGHTGFTGTSIWIDPEQDLFVILLTNRVNPTRQNTKIGAVRVALADAVVAALRPSVPPPTPARR